MPCLWVSSRELDTRIMGSQHSTYDAGRFAKAVLLWYAIFATFTL